MLTTDSNRSSFASNLSISPAVSSGVDGILNDKYACVSRFRKRLHQTNRYFIVAGVQSIAVQVKGLRAFEHRRRKVSETAVFRYYISITQKIVIGTLPEHMCASLKVMRTGMVIMQVRC